MLARYHIKRGQKIADLPARLRRGRRLDTRKHTSHCLRPSSEMVNEYLATGTDSAWSRFERQYLALLEERFAADREPFDRLRDLAGREDVFIGCSCPTAKNPDVRRCHTFLALRFMQGTYPDLGVEFPAEAIDRS